MISIKAARMDAIETEIQNNADDLRTRPQSMTQELSPITLSVAISAGKYFTTLNDMERLSRAQAVITITRQQRQNATFSGNEAERNAPSKQ